MARPRVHDLDALLDAAEELLFAGGAAGLTIRAVAERTGAPTGSLYHAFASRTELLGQTWLRAARRFLAVQRAAVDERLGDGTPTAHATAVEATLAAASTLAVLRETAPASAQVLIDHRRETLVGDGVSPALAAQLEALDGELLDVLRRLALALWDRRDRRAVETVAVCVVDLPPGLLDGRRPRAIDPLVALRAAVEGVLREPPARE